MENGKNDVKQVVKEFQPATTIRADIQALRAFAIVAVVLYHLHPTLPKGGFTGVDIFFVISGFLMTKNIVRAIDAGGFKKGRRLKFFIDFYARRIRRLAPAATFSLLFVLVCLFIFFQNNLAVVYETSFQVFLSSIFLQNWGLYSDSTDYLRQNNSATAVEHFWSLSVEEQFYFIWPAFLLLIVLLFLVLTKSRYEKNEPKIKRTLFISVLLFTIVSFIYCVYLTNVNMAAAYFVTPARLWELSIGALVALSKPFIDLLKGVKKENELSKPLKLVNEVMPFIGLGICFYAVFFLDSTKHSFPGVFALIPTIGSAIILYCGMETAKQVSQ